LLLLYGKIGNKFNMSEYTKGIDMKDETVRNTIREYYMRTP
jgi:hypothetical protein